MKLLQFGIVVIALVPGCDSMSVNAEFGNYDSKNNRTDLIRTSSNQVVVQEHGTREVASKVSQSEEIALDSLVPLLTCGPASSESATGANTAIGCAVHNEKTIYDVNWDDFQSIRIFVGEEEPLHAETREPLEGNSDWQVIFEFPVNKISSTDYISADVAFKGQVFTIKREKPFYVFVPNIIQRHPEQEKWGRIRIRDLDEWKIRRALTINLASNATAPVTKFRMESKSNERVSLVPGGTCQEPGSEDIKERLTETCTIFVEIDLLGSEFTNKVGQVDFTFHYNDGHLDREFKPVPWWRTCPDHLSGAELIKKCS